LQGVGNHMVSRSRRSLSEQDSRLTEQYWG
jgi:hypothetical protein